MKPTSGQVAYSAYQLSGPGLATRLISSPLSISLQASSLQSVHGGLQVHRGGRYCLFSYSGKRLAQVACVSVP